MSNLFCKIYTSGAVATEQLLCGLQLIIDDSVIDLNSLEAAVLGLYIDDNDEFDTSGEGQFPDGFLFFRYTFDVDFYVDDLNIGVATITKILYWLWFEMKMPAVAACHYEHLLPYNGGYKCTILPWPGKPLND